MLSYAFSLIVCFYRSPYSTHTGVTSPHWIDQTNLNDMLSRERDSPESKPQNIWSLSTQTFEQNHGPIQQPSQSTSTVTNPVNIPSTISARSPTLSVGTTPQNSILPGSAASFGVQTNQFSRVTSDRERAKSTGASSPTAIAAASAADTSDQRSIKPNRTAPPPPKTRKKSKGQSSGGGGNNADYDQDQEPTPYVYPMQRLMQKLKQHKEKERDPGATAQTGGNQSHEYAQPHGHLHNIQHDGTKQTSVTTTTSSSKRDKYQALDPKLKQSAGQYQDLLVNGLPRGQSLPTMSTFATLS